MIRVDESDPIGEIQLSFPYRDVQIQRGVDPKDFYDLEEEIGRGKFGTVYKCREKKSGLTLAAKFVSVPKKEDRRNVEREVDIMKTLQHPRLIQLYDAFENGKIMCVVLEFIEGGELFERVIDDDFVLTEKSCTVFMRQICEGIDFIHKQRILHLDMKPENILCLTRTGNRVKIIDFGLARRFDPDKKLQVLFGTPEFVAPEVVNFDQIGFGTDMWSVGVICYVLLSGLSPFMGSTDVETMANVTIGKYDFDDEAFQEISGNAKDFIAKLLHKDIGQRITADECLKHEWLKRKKTPTVPRTSSLEATKDNLKQFVERWNEHPNSPYVFELTRQGCQLGTSPHSLLGDSPSPCGSLASSLGSDTNYIKVEDPLFENMRRASDSTCIIKGSDATNRLNLAEEIRKLSDRLFQLSTMPTTVTNHSLSFDEMSLDAELPTRSVPIKIELPRDHPQSPQCSVPWRKTTKNKLNFMSRDVPLNCVGSTASASPNTPNGTKDLLLKLLDRWDDSARNKLIRHGSISNEWSEMESLEQRSISSLNNFFQSRAMNKKTHRFS